MQNTSEPMPFAEADTDECGSLPAHKNCGSLETFAAESASRLSAEKCENTLSNTQLSSRLFPTTYLEPDSQNSHCSNFIRIVSSSNDCFAFSAGALLSDATTASAHFPVDHQAAEASTEIQTRNATHKTLSACKRPKVGDESDRDSRLHQLQHILHAFVNNHSKITHDIQNDMAYGEEKIQAALSCIELLRSEIYACLSEQQACLYQLVEALPKELARIKAEASQSHIQLLLEENAKLIAKLDALQPVSTMDRLQLMKKLKEEEQSHLDDMNILSTKNRQLQNESCQFRRERDQYESIAAEITVKSDTLLQQHYQFIADLFHQLNLELPKSVPVQDLHSAVLANLGQICQKSNENARLQSLFSGPAVDLLREVNGLILKVANQHSCLRLAVAQIQDLKCSLSGHVAEIRNGFAILSADLVAAENLSSGFQNSLIKEISRYVTCLRAQVKHGFELSQMSLIEAQADSLIHLVNESIPHLMRSKSLESLNKELRSSNISLAQELSSRTEAAYKVQVKHADLEREIEELKTGKLVLAEELHKARADLSKSHESGAELDSLHKQQIEGLKVVHNQEMACLRLEIELLKHRLGEKNSLSDTFNLRERTAPSDPVHLHEKNDPLDPSNPLVNNPKLMQPNTHGTATDSAATTLSRPVMANRPLAKPVVVTFTGFRAGHPINNPNYQHRLAQMVVSLGGKVHNGVEFTDDITHVLAPHGYRSIRVLAASLTAKWIVSGEWLEACARAGHFISEMNLDTPCSGFQNLICRPFKGKALWMSTEFELSHRAHPQYPTAALKTLLEKLGRARWVANREDADYLLVMENEKISSANCLSLSELIDLIPVS